MHRNLACMDYCTENQSCLVLPPACAVLADFSYTDFTYTVATIVCLVSRSRKLSPMLVVPLSLSRCTLTSPELALTLRNHRWFSMIGRPVVLFRTSPSILMYSLDNNAGSSLPLFSLKSISPVNSLLTSRRQDAPIPVRERCLRQDLVFDPVINGEVLFNEVRAKNEGVVLIVSSEYIQIKEPVRNRTTGFVENRGTFVK